MDAEIDPRQDPKVAFLEQIDERTRRTAATTPVLYGSATDDGAPAPV
jgi:hypothetical protein